MRIRPFLSHKREDQADVAALRDVLKVYGAGGYKDVEDLRLGVKTADELRRAIYELTGGFIWWGTRNALDSRWINELEIPNAITRATVKPPYPIVPLLVDVSPSVDAAIIRAALGSHADDFLGRNGLVLDAGEDLEDFRRRVARRYVRDALGMLDRKVVTVAFRALGEPDGAHDLTFDWRGLIDPRRRQLVPGAFETMTDALCNAREAVQAMSASPELRVDADMPLPLVYLVGYEWRISTRVRLAINQRTGASFRWIEADGAAAPIVPVIEDLHDGHGATVVMASCRDGAPGAARRYAESIGARRLVTMHIDGILDDAQIRGLARATADQLRAANDRADEKHLLIVGPEALAMFTGAAANACGPVVVPFWDGTTYVSPVVVG